MTTQPAHCPVCHEPIGESCIRSLAIVPRSDDDAFARSLRDKIVVSFHRCTCGAKTSMNSTNNATYAAPQALSICCPVCGEPIRDNAIVTSYEVRGHRSLDGAPDDTETPTSISFTCKCGAVVEVTDMNQDEDHLSLFGRVMRHQESQDGTCHRFHYSIANGNVYVESDSSGWLYSALGFDSGCGYRFATKFDARDACERAIRDLSNRLQTLIEGGIFGL